MSSSATHLNMTSHRSSFAQTLRQLIPPRLHPLVLLSYPVSSLHPRSSNARDGHKAYAGGSWDGSSTGGVFSSRSSPRDWLLGPGERLYGKGPNDVLFVLFFAVALTLAREAVMRGVFAPFARKWVGAPGQQCGADWKKKGQGKGSVRRKGLANGDGKANGNGCGPGHGEGKERITPKQQRKMNKIVTRFAEQGWTATYYIISWTMGMYVIGRDTSQPFSSAYLWDGYPHTPLPGLTKFYYLAQTGFWLHQLVVINIEARRGDHHQMLTHHIVTTLLVVGSYIMNFTRVGCLILFLMDFVDIILPLAKMFGYLGLPRLTDATFVFFLVSWLLTRHIGYNAVLWSVIYRLPYRVPYVWDPENGIYSSKKVIWTFAALLAAIQVMSCMWFYLAVKVAYRVVKGGSAEDTRSDDEDDAPEDDASDATIEAHTTASKPRVNGITTDGSTTPNGVQGMPVGADDSIRKRR